ADDPDDSGAGDQVSVDAEHAARLPRQTLCQRLPATERAVVDLHGEPGAAQVGGQVEQSERRIGLHDLPPFPVFVQKVTVRGEKVSGWGRRGRGRRVVLLFWGAPQSAARRGASGGRRYTDTVNRAMHQFHALLKSGAASGPYDL